MANIPELLSGHVPIPSPVVLGQVPEKFRDAVKAMAERQQIPIYQFDHKERKGRYRQSDSAAARAGAVGRRGRSATRTTLA